MLSRAEKLKMIQEALVLEERMMKDFKEIFYYLLENEPIDETKKMLLKRNMMVLGFETAKHEQELNELYLKTAYGEELGKGEQE